MAPLRPVTIIYANPRHRGKDWCGRNGINPRSRQTVFLNDQVLRGRTLTDDDRVVFVGAVEERDDYDRVMAALAPSLIRRTREIERVA